MIARIAQALNRKDGDKGFTLVELLVVIIIIGILAAIAIPVFLNQRNKAVVASVKSDLRNAAMVIETAFADGVSMAGLIDSASVAHPVGQIAMASPYGSTWNSLDVPEYHGTGKNYITWFIATQPGTIWSRAHRESEICLAGFNRTVPELNFPTSGEATDYSKLMLWDSTLGGLTDVQEVSREVVSGGTPACDGLARQYMAAGGAY